jgi:hypothetical protein
MSYTAKQIDDRLADWGTISNLKSIQPEEINDPELSHFWGRAIDALRAFERAEDEIVRVLEAHYLKDWA